MRWLDASLADGRECELSGGLYAAIHGIAESGCGTERELDEQATQRLAQVRGCITDSKLALLFLMVVWLSSVAVRRFLRPLA